MTTVTEYQRAVFFRFGRIRSAAKGPGLIVRFPGADRVVKVNLRVEVVDIPPQTAITKDNVTVQVDAVCLLQGARSGEGGHRRRQLPPRLASGWR